VYEKTELETKRRDLQSEFDTMKREQDDLLMLLSEQEAKMTSFKRRLKDLGQSVSYCLY
jgi:predicted nuclease with TOPRIM domain